MPELIVAERGAVTTLTLNRPASLNALTYDLIDQLTDAIGRADASDACRVLVVRGEGRAFCAGDDMKASEEVLGERWRGLHAKESSLGQIGLIRRMRTCSKPTVAVVQGYALGVGFDLALAADFRICGRTAQLGDPRSRNAMFPASGACYLLPRMIGYGRALKMLMLGERVGAEEAERIGLASLVVPDEELGDRADEFVDQLAAAPTRALSAIKQLVREQIDLPFEQASVLASQLRASIVIEDQQEGVRAFREKRAPQFTGR